MTALMQVSCELASTCPRVRVSEVIHVAGGQVRPLQGGGAASQGRPPRRQPPVRGRGHAPHARLHGPQPGDQTY